MATVGSKRRLVVLVGHTLCDSKTKPYTQPLACAALSSRAKRVAVIGTGISGTAAMKSILEEGMEVVCFEKKDSIGGFWNYREDPRFPSVYGCTHIDSKRDHNSFSTVPCSPEMPQVMNHRDVVDYLHRNHSECNLAPHIRFNHEVVWITDASNDQDNGLKRWRVDYVDSSGGRQSEVFEGVMICSGRHSRARLPVYEGMDLFKGLQIHTNRFKDAETHGLVDKRVVVVGVGNSGNDMVTELAPISSKLWWVARRGTWIYEAKGNPSKLIGHDRILFGWSLAIPWQLTTRKIEKSMLKSQEKLNRVGLQPDHHILSAHPSQTGGARGTREERGANGSPVKPDVETIHDLCEAGLISGKRGIDRITENGVIFSDGEEVECDAIIWATGFKQAVEFIDPKIVDMRYDREDVEVADKLYQYAWPMSPGCGSIAFISFCQSFTFMCADLQTRLFARVVRGDIYLPTVAAQEAEMRAFDGELKQQFTSSPRHAIQGATKMAYYDNLAKMIGCYPSFWKVLTTRPSAFRHAFFTPWSAMGYRLVGHGATAEATRIIDGQVASTQQSVGGSPLLTIGKGWPNFQYFKRLRSTIKEASNGFDGSTLPRPDYLASEHMYSARENVTQEQNANVAGSRSEQQAGVATIVAQSNL